MESSSNKDSISHISLSNSIERQHITDINLFTLKRALPLNYNYIIDSFKVIQALKFFGAFSKPFEAKFCVNIYTANKIKAWLEEFSDLHKTTMRETRDQAIKEAAFFALFHAGHGPASAYYTYTEEIQLKYDNDEEVLADRTICPQKYDIYYLHKKFLDQSISARNRKEMFS
ncbi:hypothetical protein F8M41_003645 [Gigaspora margarita]|uniref:Uncharacterized protein n=1 Tax=Gigaspora margarita TaxID=4874 RepID=A0A8H4ES41_GIGMA|nr:hypothetical protein F8M41_003645 [Gigaspora margarita]